ncbi:MAG TPA: FAD-binding domain [Rhizomicrobium sp.]|nr:FAD-binding domain [Rhizomicrobium sp.]
MARTVLISGIGIAGPTLAFWLLKQGLEPVLVERAPGLRTGGYILDFWGIGFDVAERMGLLPRLRQVGYHNDRVAFVRADGHVRSAFGGTALHRALGERYLSIQRGDLAREIFRTIETGVETIFGDSIATMCELPDGVQVGFESGRSRRFDMVVGADGLHSAVRRTLSGEPAHSSRYLGYCAAAFVTRGYPRRDEHVYLSYAAPGRQISRFALRDDGTGFLLVFAWPDETNSMPRDVPSQMQLLVEQFGQSRWREWPEILQHLRSADNLYFDAVSQVRLPAWSKGRVVLLGDAAYCPSLLSGEGSAFAMAGAYILAGELQRASGDYGEAFPAYEQRFRPFIERKQRAARAFVSSFAPKTSAGLAARDFVLKLGGISAIADLLMRHFVADRYELPDYAETDARALTPQ